MKLILSGLSPETDLANLTKRMSRFGPVRGVRPVREGDPQRPWFIVDLDLPHGAAVCGRAPHRRHLFQRPLPARLALPCAMRLMR